MDVNGRTLPVAALVAILVLALMTIGVAYGLWSNALLIDGSISTGEVDARWEFVTCSEFYPWPNGGNSGEYEGKDVGKTNWAIDPDDDQILHITVENAYPSYAVNCEVHFVVEGTIPVHLLGTRIIPVKNLNDCLLTGEQVKTLTCDEMTIEYWDGIESQIHPGDGGSGSLRFHVEQEAEQESSYEFEVGICFAQWNEGATAAECFEAAQ